MKSFKTLLTATLGAAAISAAAWADTPAPQAPNEVIYLPQLPTATELSQTAAAQGQTVSRIEQSNGQVTAVYSNANGQSTVISYQLLPTQEQAQVGAPAAAAPYAYAPPQGVVVQQPATPAPVVTETAPASSVVYGSDYAMYPYDYYPYYGYGYYGPWYPGVRVGFGWGGYGYRGGWGHGGYYRGAGFHGGGSRGGGHASGGRGGHR